MLAMSRTLDIISCSAAVDIAPPKVLLASAELRMRSELQIATFVFLPKKSALLIKAFVALIQHLHSGKQRNDGFACLLQPGVIRGGHGHVHWPKPLLTNVYTHVYRVGSFMRRGVCGSVRDRSGHRRLEGREGLERGPGGLPIFFYHGRFVTEKDHDARMRGRDADV